MTTSVLNHQINKVVVKCVEDIGAVTFNAVLDLYHKIANDLETFFIYVF